MGYSHNMKIDLINEIKHCWGSKSTGALFIKLSNRRLLQLFFVSGELQSVKCRGDVGMEAIKEAIFVEPIKSQFYLGLVNPANNNLPPTVDIIDMLNASFFDRKPIVEKAVSFISEAVSSADIKAVSDADRAVVKGVFIEYVGPIADIIFPEELQSVDSVESLIESLSVHIDSDESQEKFRDEIMSKLK